MGGPLLACDEAGEMSGDTVLHPAQRLRSAVRVSGRMRTASVECVAEEVPVAMVYNGISHAVMLATPADLEDFGTGFSLAEGIVARASEIHDIDTAHHVDGIEVRMQVSNRAFDALKARRRSLAGRTGCGLCGVDSLGQVSREVKPVAARPSVDEAAIHRAFVALGEGQALHALTGSVHAAAWAHADGTLFAVREDVGRHNALDKLIGAVALAGLDTTQGFAVVTSRASYEMVLKLASVGGGLLAAISAPTGLAIDLAGRTGVTLCGFVRDGRMAIYTESRTCTATQTE
ncbi:MAG: formate dehydrogenase accessory sulfurtransferase FdhD [Methyloversatilis discipulorum]|uniref:formate dehydrogenase accessory sulfurtransferase FdhD n=1 Tax=Methyloversatilis discipulorum TaxID=1119528 RepID=UPI0026F188EB|nr:formate dehydrogenase accessory sulfurtransferase FdhD [Methyloversatilis discipulorum]MBT9517697.1 formate dehydrogenase accessory sulfurtransferase FdhD [Methyloversatilis discipulorum]